jgi:hypothetical protein
MSGNQYSKSDDLLLSKVREEAQKEIIELGETRDRPSRRNLLRNQRLIPSTGEAEEHAAPGQTNSDSKIPSSFDRESGRVIKMIPASGPQATALTEKTRKLVISHIRTHPQLDAPWVITPAGKAPQWSHQTWNDYGIWATREKARQKEEAVVSARSRSPGGWRRLAAEKAVAAEKAKAAAEKAVKVAQHQRHVADDAAGFTLKSDYRKDRELQKLWKQEVGDLHDYVHVPGKEMETVTRAALQMYTGQEPTDEDLAAAIFEMRATAAGSRGAVNFDEFAAWYRRQGGQFGKLGAHAEAWDDPDFSESRVQTVRAWDDQWRSWKPNLQKYNASREIVGVRRGSPEKPSAFQQTEIDARKPYTEREWQAHRKLNRRKQKPSSCVGWACGHRRNTKWGDGGGLFPKTKTKTTSKRKKTIRRKAAKRQSVRIKSTEYTKFDKTKKTRKSPKKKKTKKKSKPNDKDGKTDNWLMSAPSGGHEITDIIPKEVENPVHGKK